MDMMPETIPSGQMESDQEHDNLIDQIRDLQERLEQLERYALTSGIIQADRLALGLTDVTELMDGDLAMDGYLYSGIVGSQIIVSAILGLPYLRGAWNLGTIRATSPHIRDITISGNHLINVGVQALNIDDIISCGSWGVAGSDRIYGADSSEFDIQGNETYVTTAYRGLTMGAWIRYAAGSWGSVNNVIGKWTYTGNQRSYNLRLGGSGKPNFYVSGDGTASINKASGVAADLSNGSWSFIAGRYDPSTEIKVYHGKDGELFEDAETSGIPATLFNGTSQFELGSYDGGGGYWQGQIAFPFLCFARLPNIFLTRYYEMTKRIFGH